jgi:GNAT superfamily N-acetyltransferase
MGAVSFKNSVMVCGSAGADLLFMVCFVRKTARRINQIQEQKMEIKEYTEFKQSEVLDLYTQVGWTAYTENMLALEQGYKKSLLILAAYENDELLGIVRAVGDGFTIILVQDILVYPKYQRHGIGTALLKAVLDKYSDVRQLQLVTDNTPKTVAFYKSLGFLNFSEIGCCGFMRA